MMRNYLLAGAVICLPTVAFAIPPILYSEDFDADPTANWTVNDPGITDIVADFFYDYSAIGVPPAPNGSGTTSGLKMTANNTTGVFGGFSVSPNGQNFAGNYTVTFDLWSNYVGPLDTGGSGTTQLSMYGIGTAGNVPVWPGSTPKESVGFATTLDGGSSADVRVYSSLFPFSHPGGDPVYAAPGGSRNASDPYYAQFGGNSAPAAQVALFPGQTGTTGLGVMGFAWREVVIDIESNIAEWYVDGLLMATIDLTTVDLGGGNIFFGHSDTNNGSSTDPNASLLNVTLIDNIVVTPEPTSLAMLAIGGLALLRRRK
jgi:hypothetical protein